MIKSSASKFFLPKTCEVFFSVITLRFFLASILRLTLSTSCLSAQSLSLQISSGVGGSIADSLFQSNLLLIRLSLRRHFISYLDKEPNSQNSYSRSLSQESYSLPSQSLIFSFSMQVFQRQLQILRFQKAERKAQSLLECETSVTSLVMIFQRQVSRSGILEDKS